MAPSVFLYLNLDVGKVELTCYIKRNGHCLFLLSQGFYS
ncbi:MAG: hypothetical protein PWP24_574 [Clostridiales bacterium]|nr:hypothetical protein [Clostridiales bacterium]